MNEPRPYDPAAIEPRWQQTWETAQAFRTRDDLPRDKCYYVLEMFPYPSGKLHMGHVRNYSIGDAVARYKRMRGLHVLHPMGWDSFGLPAEQAAIERGAPPKAWTYQNIAYMRTQLKRMGFSYDWTREFACSDPGYAAREQDIFLDLVEKGLVYRKSSLVNWSTGLNCVLANEQVVDGKCWRTGMPVVQKELPQWYLRITAYADDLLAQLDALKGSWPDAVLTQQRNWIGRSEGAEVDFAIDGQSDLKLTVFTTRPDTLFGVTFMSIAPEHRLLERIVPDSHRAAVEAFKTEVRAVSAQERIGDTAEKKGVFTGAYAVNPADGRKVPLYAANFVVADYGTGAVMAVPAHDERDHAFAVKYGIPIVEVVRPADPSSARPVAEAAYTEPGVLTASGHFDGQPSEAAKAAITAWLEQRGVGRKVVTWRLRDWCLSRQRYWGNPIPYAYTDTLGAVPLRKADLPVTLPEDVVFDGKGNPLERHLTWAVTGNDGQPLTVRGPKGPEAARRETDTCDTFMESSWYFARYACHDNTRADLGCAAPLDRARVDHWLPVDLYIGGIEHAVMHLLYARFFQKALCDIGYSSRREPFKRLLCQGMVCMETLYRENPGEKKQYFYPDEVAVERDPKGRVVKATAKGDGAPVLIGRVQKMSKSLRNTVDPQALIDQYGADSARLFVLSNVPPELDVVWSEDGIRGSHRYLKRLWLLVTEHAERLRAVAPYAGKAAAVAGIDQAVVRKVHAVVKRCTDALEKDFAFNTAVAQCMELTNELKPDQLDPAVLKLGLATLVRLIAPICPHISEELWVMLGGEGGVTAAGWPAYDESEIAGDTVEYPVQVNGKVRGRITLDRTLTGAALEAAVQTNPVFTSAIEGKTVKKLVIVPGKIINVVVG